MRCSGMKRSRLSLARPPPSLTNHRLASPVLCVSWAHDFEGLREQAPWPVSFGANGDLISFDQVAGRQGVNRRPWLICLAGFEDCYLGGTSHFKRTGIAITN